MAYQETDCGSVPVERKTIYRDCVLLRQRIRVGSTRRCEHREGQSGDRQASLTHLWTRREKLRIIPKHPKPVAGSGPRCPIPPIPPRDLTTGLAVAQCYDRERTVVPLIPDSLLILSNCWALLLLPHFPQVIHIRPCQICCKAKVQHATQL